MKKAYNVFALCYNRLAIVLRKCFNCFRDGGAVAGTARKETTFISYGVPFPFDKNLFDTYKKREKIYDKKFFLLAKKGGIGKEQYEASKHYFALGILD